MAWLYLWCFFRKRMMMMMMIIVLFCFVLFVGERERSGCHCRHKVCRYRHYDVVDPRCCCCCYCNSYYCLWLECCHCVRGREVNVVRSFWVHCEPVYLYTKMMMMIFDLRKLLVLLFRKRRQQEGGRVTSCGADKANKREVAMQVKVVCLQG